MNDSVVHLQPAYVLHSRNYKETSLILEMLTRDFGKVRVVAKGVRKSKSKTAALLRPFASLTVSYLGGGGLKTLTQVELTAPLASMSGMPLYCAFYLNDLVMHFLPVADPHPAVYFDYHDCLLQLAENKALDKTLRLFEINLLENVGYALQLEYDYCNGRPIEAAKRYQFHAESGACENAHGAYSGEMLIALRNRNLDDGKIRLEAKKLLRTVIDHHLPDKKLYSRILIGQHLKYTKTGNNE